MCTRVCMYECVDGKRKETSEKTQPSAHPSPTPPRLHVAAQTRCGAGNLGMRARGTEGELGQMMRGEEDGKRRLKGRERRTSDVLCMAPLSHSGKRAKVACYGKSAVNWARGKGINSAHV